MFGPFWTLATSFVHGAGAAAGIALINSVGNIGGFVGPYGIGYLTTGRAASPPDCWRSGWWSSRAARWC